MEEIFLKHIRTDLALETKEGLQSRKSVEDGIEVREEKIPDSDITITRMNIATRKASAIMKRSMGKYVTMEIPELREEDEGYHRNVSVVLARELNEMIKEHIDKKIPNILIAGLGNRDATADALGPLVVSNLLITRHIVEYMGYDEVEGANAVTSAIIPGVMAQTGMDTSEIIGAIIKKIKPDILIAVDALAARSIHRLNCALQITNTGIYPGSGVGNNRQEITKKTMGIPVIAIGVPTVIDATTLICDLAGERLPEGIQEDSKEFANMYITSKDVDAIVKRVSYTISEGINICMGLNR